ncbi:hypothetical protein P3T23_005701 [Paraburkholderia sp. GAS448]
MVLALKQAACFRANKEGRVESRNIASRKAWNCHILPNRLALYGWQYSPDQAPIPTLNHHGEGDESPPPLQE